MAEKRMFTKKITNSDAFMDMPHSTQTLYFHLNMEADDDGFINNPKSIMRKLRCADDDMRMLITKKYIIPFESGVVVIKHWRLHNLIRKDRYHETEYVEEKSLLEEKNNGVYTLSCSDGNQMATNGIPNGNQTATEVRLGKVSIDKLNTYAQNEHECDQKKEPNEHVDDQKYDQKTYSFDPNRLFESFWDAYPRKVSKKKSKEIFVKVCKSQEIYNDIMKGLTTQIMNKKLKKNDQYTPHPRTWLSQERWKDEVEENAGTTKPVAGTKDKFGIPIL